MDLADAYRFEFVVATMHWAHTELAVDLHVERDGPAALLTAVVTHFGDYWDVPFVPERAALRCSGVVTASELPGFVRIEVTSTAPFAAMTFDPAKQRVEILAIDGHPEALPDFWDPLLTWAHAHWIRECRIPARILVLDADARPPACAAVFTDANGREVRVHDKDPIFRDDFDPPDQGEVRGTVIAVTTADGTRVCRVSLVQPWDLETTDGETEVLIRETDLRWP